jgi:hypothetical protein
MLLLCVNEVSHFVLCAWDYLEGNGCRELMRERSSGVHATPPESISSALSLFLYIVILATSIRELCIRSELHPLKLEVRLNNILKFIFSPRKYVVITLELLAFNGLSETFISLFCDTNEI